MSIRARLTLWYGALLLAGLALIFGWTYYEVFIEHPEIARALSRSKHTPLEEMGEILLFGGLPAAVLALGGGWFLMRRALAPVTELTRAVERVQAENLHQPIAPSGNGDELDRLTEVFNQMTRRLDQSFQQIREFTLHASHELKTPLTILRHELDSVLQDEFASAAERERAAAMLEEIERLSQIVDGLHFLTRSDAGQLTWEKEPVALDELLHDATDDAQALAEEQHIRVQLDSCPATSVMGDRRRLRQLLLILTDNAIKYNITNGAVNIALQQQGNRALLTVTNTGPGIPPEMVGRVFERFFRADPSHNRAVDGCGLGLTIAQSIVRAHGGEILVESQPGRLTTVRVTLPALAPGTITATRSESDLQTA